MTIGKKVNFTPLMYPFSSSYPGLGGPDILSTGKNLPFLQVNPETFLASQFQWEASSSILDAHTTSTGYLRQVGSAPFLQVPSGCLSSPSTQPMKCISDAKYHYFGHYLMFIATGEGYN